MNWTKAGWLAVAMVALGVAGAQAEFVRGDINGWTATVGMDTNRGFAGDQFYSVTLTGTATRVSSGFQFTQHATWDPQWGTGSRATNAVVNSTIGQGHINRDGNSPGNLSFAEFVGRKYTFRLWSLARRGSGHGVK